MVTQSCSASDSHPNSMSKRRRRIVLIEFFSATNKWNSRIRVSIEFGKFFSHNRDETGTRYDPVESYQRQWSKRPDDGEQLSSRVSDNNSSSNSKRNGTAIPLQPCSASQSRKRRFGETRFAPGRSNGGMCSGRRVLETTAKSMSSLDGKGEGTGKWRDSWESRPFGKIGWPRCTDG